METIVGLLSESASKFGDSPALLIKPGFRQDRWSYKRLDAFSGQVAAYLSARGIGPRDTVLMWAPNRPEWVAAYFGILKTGAIVVPLDVRSASDFVEKVAAQVDAKLLVLGRQGMPAHGPVQTPTLYLEDLDRLARGLSAATFRPPAIQRDDIALIIFTSGTTGDPKGVMLTHGNVVSNVIATRPVFPITPGHRLLSLLPLSHMFEMTAGLLAVLAGGGRVVYPVSRQPNVLFRTMRENRVTSLVVVPQALQLFMNGIEREVAKQGKTAVWARLNALAKRLPKRGKRILFRSVLKQFGGNLREIISGGAYLDPDLGAKWERLGIEVLQGYGTTEAAPAVSFNVSKGRRLDSVGKVLPGQEIMIAADGEVLTRGPNVTPGYWRNPEATAAAFTNGWYKTGDLGAIEPDGHLVLKGRKKDLIVLANGQNVYPDDIEGVLRRHPNVADAVVLGVQTGGDVQVTAVLLLREPGPTKEITEWANRQLADHQHIGAAVLWTEPDFPRTHTLKVKKPLVLNWLQSLGSATEKPKEVTAVAADAPPLWKIIAELAERPVTAIQPAMTLGGDLGLDSLGRVELLSYVEQELGVYIDESTILTSTTVGDLDRIISGGATGAAKVKGYGWAQNLWARAVRELSMSGLIFPVLSLFYRLEVTGKDNLEAVDGPVLLAANHCLHLDNPLILKALPGKVRRKLAIAAAADDIFGSKWRAPLAALLGNAFPFSRDGAIRASLERLGELLDKGYSVLIYPEGKLTVGGPMQPFKAGTGLVATESKTPVVPIWFQVKRMGLADGKFWPLRGSIKIHFGRPIKFEQGDSAAEATQKLEHAVRDLAVSETGG